MPIYKTAETTVIEIPLRLAKEFRRLTEFRIKCIERKLIQTDSPYMREMLNYELRVTRRMLAVLMEAI